MGRPTLMNKKEKKYYKLLDEYGEAQWREAGEEYKKFQKRLVDKYGRNVVSHMKEELGIWD